MADSQTAQAWPGAANYKPQAQAAQAKPWPGAGAYKAPQAAQAKPWPGAQQYARTTPPENKIALTPQSNWDKFGPLKPGEPTMSQGPDALSTAAADKTLPIGARVTAAAGEEFIAQPLEQIKKFLDPNATEEERVAASTNLALAFGLKGAPEGEAIKSPAVKSGAEVTEGVNHPTLRAETGLKAPEPGFTTTTGAFVPRKEGAEIAKEAGQAKPETGAALHSEDLISRNAEGRPIIGKAAPAPTGEVIKWPGKEAYKPPEVKPPTRSERPAAQSVGAAKTPTAELLRYNILDYNEKNPTPPWHKEFAANMRQAAKSVAQIFAPEKIGLGKDAAASIRKFSGRAARASEQAKKGMDQFRQTIADQTTLEQKLDLLKWLQKPSEAAMHAFAPDPAIKPFLAAFSDLMVRQRIKLESLPKTEEMAFKEDYVTQMWKKPQEAMDYLHNLGPKQGSNSFTKRTVFEDYEEGIRAGFVPATLDPIELAMRYVENTEKWMALNQVLDQGAKDAHIVWRSPEHAPAGWVKLDGRAANYKGPMQDAYAPPEFAAVYNTWVSKAPQGAAGDIFQWYTRASNMATGVKLALSYFHGGLETEEGLSNGLTNAIDKLAGGDIWGGVKEGVRAPFKPITSLRKGLEVQRAYLDDQYGDPQMQRIVRALTDANFNIAGRGRIADEYRMSRTGGFLQAWQRGILKLEAKKSLEEIKANPALGAIRGAGKMLDTAMEPIFQYYVPLLKNGAALDAMKTFLEQNPLADEAALAKKAIEVADTMDNRFGEMNQDNIFWQRTLKMMAQAAFTSFSYTYGTARMALGAARDVATLPARALKGEKLWTSRMSYVIAVAVANVLTNSIFQYLHTGKPPENLRDAFFPQTGGTDLSTQQPARAVTPSYATQFFNLWEHPGQELTNKFSTLSKLIVDLASNQDWRSDPITNQNAPYMQQFEQLGEHVWGELAEPIYISGQRKGGTNISEPERFFGVREAPQYAVAPKKYQDTQSYVKARSWVLKQQHDLNAQRSEHGLPPRHWTRKQTDEMIHGEMNKYRGAQ